jgi:hypothetical protein
MCGVFRTTLEDNVALAAADPRIAVGRGHGSCFAHDPLLMTRVGRGAAFALPGWRPVSAADVRSACRAAGLHDEIMTLKVSRTALGLGLVPAAPHAARSLLRATPRARHRPDLPSRATRCVPCSVGSSA